MAKTPRSREVAKKRSIERAKETTLKVVDETGKEIAGLMVPVLGKIAWVGGSQLAKQARAFMQEKAERRLTALYEKLTSGDETAEQDAQASIHNEPISGDHFYAALDSAVHDLEEEKLEVYSAGLKAMGRGAVDRRLFTDYLRALKELSLRDLEILRALYIAGRYEFVGDGDPASQLSAYSDRSTSPVTQVAIQNLVRLGLARRIENRGSPCHGPTTFGDVLAETIYGRSRLGPADINRENAAGIPVFLVRVDPEQLRLMGAKSPYFQIKQSRDAWLTAVESSLGAAGIPYIACKYGVYQKAIRQARAVIVCDDFDGGLGTIRRETDEATLIVLSTETPPTDSAIESLLIAVKKRLTRAP